MRFSFVSLLALAASVIAQDKPNSFNLPTGTLVFQAGQAKTLTWDNKAGNTVTLVLKNGDQSNLMTVDTIAKSIPNSGSYTWTPPADTPEGSNYAIEIINDDDPSDINYTTQFVVQSDVKAVASGSSSGVVTATSASLVTSEPTSPATGSTTGSASASASATGSASGMTTHTGSASASSSSAASKTSGASSSTAASGASVPTTNAGAKPAIAAAGSLLAVAAGFAIAL